MGLDIPDGHVPAGVYNARILPAQAVQQRLVIGPHRGEILLRVAFRRHQKHRVLDRICQIGAQFRHREQPVKGASQLSGDAPVIHGRGQHHHIRGHVGRIHGVHAVPLDTGVPGIPSAAQAAPAAVDVQSGQIEPGNGVARRLRSGSKRVDQRRSVSVDAGAAVENQNLL